MAARSNSPEKRICKACYLFANIGPWKAALNLHLISKSTVAASTSILSFLMSTFCAYLVEFTASGLPAMRLIKE
jgi:hypothetical protein